MISQSDNGSYICGKGNSLDIIAEMIKESEYGIKKTQMMYNTGMSFAQINGKKGSDKDGFLNEILLCELIKADNGDYRATDRGKEFLKYYDIMKGFLKPGNSPRYEPLPTSQRIAVNDNSQKNNGESKKFRAHRTPYEIYSKCVDASVGKKKKMQVMFKTDLNSAYFKKYDLRLKHFGLWVEEGGIFSATQKGIDFSTVYKIVKSFLRKPVDDSVSIRTPLNIVPNGKSHNIINS